MKERPILFSGEMVRAILDGTSARLTSEELHILQHSLGLDSFGQGRSHRNHFVTDPEGSDGQKIQKLIELGFMLDLGAQALASGMHCYKVTPAGVDAVALQSPLPPKLAAGQQRYRRYLRSDGFESFRDFLAWESRENRAKKLGFSSVREMDAWEREGGAA